MVIERRYAEGRSDRLPELAAELVALGPKVIVAADTPSIAAAQQATRAIPIVMATAGDPISQRFVEALDRPGGNITGIATISTELAMKRLELLKEVVPSLTDVAVMWDPSNPVRQRDWDSTVEAARVLGLRVHAAPVEGPEDFEAAFVLARHAGAGGAVVFADQVFSANRSRFFDIAESYPLPLVFEGSQWVDRGGLLAYGPSISDRFRRSAVFVDKILKGADPAVLPVEQPTRFELAVNMRVARALGLTMPESIITMAERVVD
jgi:putative ABC transport system substrate-binding protein